jgi:hypothetical protein
VKERWKIKEERLIMIIEKKIGVFLYCLVYVCLLSVAILA